MTTKRGCRAASAPLWATRTRAGVRGIAAYGVNPLIVESGPSRGGTWPRQVPPSPDQISTQLPRFLLPISFGNRSVRLRFYRAELIILPRKDRRITEGSLDPNRRRKERTRSARGPGQNPASIKLSLFFIQGLPISAGPLRSRRRRPYPILVGPSCSRLAPAERCAHARAEHRALRSRRSTAEGKFKKIELRQARC